MESAFGQRNGNDIRTIAFGAEVICPSLRYRLQCCRTREGLEQALFDQHENTRARFTCAANSTKFLNFDSSIAILIEAVEFRTDCINRLCARFEGCRGASGGFGHDG